MYLKVGLVGLWTDHQKICSKKELGQIASQNWQSDHILVKIEGTCVYALPRDLVAWTILELNNDLVQMASWDGQEYNRICIARI